MSIPKDFYKEQAYGNLLIVSLNLLKGFYEKPALLQREATESPKTAHVVPGTHYAKANSGEPPAPLFVRLRTPARQGLLAPPRPLGLNARGHPATRPGGDSMRQ